MGDAISVWESIAKDTSHGHFAVFVYDPIKDALVTYASGCDPANSSSHKETFKHVS